MNCIWKKNWRRVIIWLTFSNKYFRTNVFNAGKTSSIKTSQIVECRNIDSKTRNLSFIPFAQLKSRTKSMIKHYDSKRKLMNMEIHQREGMHLCETTKA